MTNARRIFSAVVFGLAVAGCVSKSQIESAIERLDSAWKEVNDRTFAEDGHRILEATKYQAFTATQKAALRLSMVIEAQDYETGFIFVTAPAPTPLSAAEWVEVQEADTPEFQSLISKEVGPAGWFRTLDSTGKDVLVNVLVTETLKGVEVSLGMRLRNQRQALGRVRRTQAPPTAVRMGVEKFWKSFDQELQSVVATAPAAPDKPAPPPTAETPQEPPVVLTPPSEPAVKNPESVAVIIGNRDYRSRVPDVDFAHNDAEAMKRFVLGVLGYRVGNIIDLRDATQADMDAVFGNARTHKGKLWRWARPEESDVVVFYSGHGVPGLKDRRAYLLPVNADPNAPEINGYPVDQLYANLAGLNARSVTVFLDACFSGESPRGMLVSSLSGLSVTPKMPTEMQINVLTAAQGNQVASWDEEARQGLFTKYLLQALYGASDSRPYGNSDGRVTLREVKSYLDREMTYAARRQFGRDQKATIRGDLNKVLAILSDTAARSLVETY